MLFNQSWQIKPTMETHVLVKPRSAGSRTNMYPKVSRGRHGRRRRSRGQGRFTFQRVLPCDLRDPRGNMDTKVSRRSRGKRRRSRRRDLRCYGVYSYELANRRFASGFRLVRSAILIAAPVSQLFRAAIPTRMEKAPSRTVAD